MLSLQVDFCLVLPPHLHRILLHKNRVVTDVLQRLLGVLGGSIPHPPELHHDAILPHPMLHDLGDEKTARLDLPLLTLRRGLPIVFTSVASRRLTTQKLVSATPNDRGQGRGREDETLTMGKWTEDTS